jgi:hypothetical protein
VVYRNAQSQYILATGICAGSAVCLILGILIIFQQVRTNMLKKLLFSISQKDVQDMSLKAEKLIQSIDVLLLYSRSPQLSGTHLLMVWPGNHGAKGNWVSAGAICCGNLSSTRRSTWQSKFISSYCMSIISGGVTSC